MSLLDLPVEIFEQIVALLVPDSIEDVALACKATYQKSARIVKRHNALLKRFRRFRYDPVKELQVGPDRQTLGSLAELQHNEQGLPVFGSHQANRAQAVQFSEQSGGALPEGPGNDVPVKIHNVIQLLEYIAEHPIVARYIEVADFSNDSLGLHIQLDEEPKAPLIRRSRAALARLVQSSSYLAEIGCDATAWLESMDSGLGGHADAFLLTLLPNLQKVNISERFAHYWFNDEIDPLLRAIVERTKLNPAGAAVSLAKLEEVHGRLEFDSHDAYSLKGVGKLMAIPSIRSFSGDAFVAVCSDREESETQFEAVELFSPNLERVEMVWSVLGAHASLGLFSRMQNLTTFRLLWDWKYDEGASCNFGALLANIQDAVGDTLEELSVLCTDGLNDNGTTLGNMSGFKKLNTFQASYNLLHGPEYDPDEEFEDSWVELGEDAVHHRLVDILPASIENVLIYFYCQQEKDYSGYWIFEGLSEQRAARLPKLQELKVVMPLTAPEYVSIPEATEFLVKSAEESGAVVIDLEEWTCEYVRRKFEMDS